MTRIEAHFRVVTPMFLAGFEQSQAELRVASIKGVLRFWWRALEHERLGVRLSEVESEIFGSTQRQSSMLLRVEQKSGLEFYAPGKVLPETDSANKHDDVNHGVRYFGYGVMEAFDGQETKAGRLLRGALSPGELTLHLTLKHNHHQDSILKALKLMGLLGGLGSKSRKGYGSLSLVKICQKSQAEPLWEAPSGLEDLKKELKDLLDYARQSKPFDSNAVEPSITAFSQLSHMVLLPTKSSTSAMKLLNLVGREMIRFRSYGKNNQVLAAKQQNGGWTGEAHEKNFQVDHDQMKLAPSARTLHPERVVFGLPHNYGMPQKDHVTAVIPSSDGDIDKSIERRASPLFIHLHQPLLEHDPIVVIVFLPAQFLPNDAKVNVGGEHIALAANHWQPILDFLERLKGVPGATPPKKRVEVFDKVVEVK